MAVQCYLAHKKTGAGERVGGPAADLPHALPEAPHDGDRSALPLSSSSALLLSRLELSDTKVYEP